MIANINNKLIDAVINGQLDLVKDLVSKGADLNAETLKGETLMELAAIHEHPDIFIYLGGKPIVGRQNMAGWRSVTLRS